MDDCGHRCCPIAANAYHRHTDPPADCARCDDAGEPGAGPVDLGVRLSRWAADSGPAIEAAVQRLVASPWLGHERLVAACVVPVEPDLAVVDWAALAAFLDGPLASTTGPAVDTLRAVLADARRAATDTEPATDPAVTREQAAREPA